MNYDYDRSLGRVLRSACFALSLLHERSRDTDQGYCYVLYIYMFTELPILMIAGLRPNPL